MSTKRLHKDLLIPPVEEAEDASRQSQLLRNALLVGLVLFVGAGLINVFGVRATTATTTVGDLEVEVVHPAVARPGLSAPLTVTLRRSGGFPGPVEVAMSNDYLARFDENGLDPQPDSATTSEEMLRWTWDEVDGDTFIVDFDARIEPGVHWKFDGRVEASVGDESAAVDIITWVAP